MWRYHGYLRKSDYEEEEGEEPTVLLDSAAARLVKINIWIGIWIRKILTSRLEVWEQPFSPQPERPHRLPAPPLLSTPSSQPLGHTQPGGKKNHCPEWSRAGLLIGHIFLKTQGKSTKTKELNKQISWIFPKYYTQTFFCAFSKKLKASRKKLKAHFEQKTQPIGG